ncbi:MAG: response regulator [Chitinivibrionales bacterium]|nr:response regulator [Chitinivibrionales bacterium]
MQRNTRVLVVDDELSMREIIQSALDKEGFQLSTAGDVPNACCMAEKEEYDLVLTDLNMPGSNGIELVRFIKEKSLTTSIIVITAFPDNEKVRQLQELEIDSFIIKPFSLKQLRYSVFGALEKRKTLARNREMGTVAESNSDLGLVGVSPYIKKLRTEILLMAAGDFPVCIQGESGTGKEIIAHAIHNNSGRRNETMITINCGAIPHHLEESEFFGYVKGAFTGAHSSKQGVLESANDSTVFLDEIGELSLSVQAKLLRVLDVGEFVRVGDVSPRNVDIRIVSATNRNLENMVDDGGFRKDLFYRLKGAVIGTLPLAKHREDIPYLVRHFLNTYHHGKHITPDAMSFLSNYKWPGNIRELKHMVNLICTKGRDQKRINSSTVKSVLKLEKTTGGNLPYAAARTEFEKKYFTTMLEKHEGNVSHVAREVGMHRPNLIRKLKELEISPDNFRIAHAEARSAKS